jgi:hypothetical protein
MTPARVRHKPFRHLQRNRKSAARESQASLRICRKRFAIEEFHREEENLVINVLDSRAY